MDDWINDAYVKEWFKGLSERSVESYKRSFPKWLAFINMTPTQQIKRQLKNLQNPNPRQRDYFQRKIVDYKILLEKQGYGKNTIENSLLSAVQSFFSRNRIPLKFKKGELRVERANKAFKEWIPSNEEIRVLYATANLRDRALLLVLYQSGFSEIDVSNMNVDDFDFYDQKGEWKIEDKHLYVRRFREKTDVPQETCISEEAIYNIKLMLQAKDFPKKGALFTSHKGIKRGAEEKRRLTVRFIHSTMKKLCQKALPHHAKDFQTKSLRDAYHDALARADVKESIQKRLFGHKPIGAEANYYVSPQTIQEAYKKAFRYLSINSGRRYQETIERQNQKIETLTETLVKLTKELLKQGKLSKDFVEKLPIHA